MSGGRVIAWARRHAAAAPFELGVALVAIVYVVLHLSPSSYALALGQLGDEHQPLLGSPRAIRSDEWAVTTPLFQSAVRNDFNEVNETSFYGESLRSFIGLPLLNWGLVFKPLVLPFFVLPPDIAYSFFWAASAALFLIGWSLLLREFGFSKLVAALSTMLMYFTPFVQAWSTTPPQVAFFPFIVLAAVRLRAPSHVVVALTLLVPTWLLTTFYVPALPPLLFLAIVLCLAFKPAVFVGRRMAAVIVGSAIGVGITLGYYAPVLRAYSGSEYPGQRWIDGGGMSPWQAASQFLPGTTTEGFTNLIGPNVSEAATMATWLPLLTLCVVDLETVRRRYDTDLAVRRHCHAIGVLLGGWAVLTIWQLVPVPPLSYLLGLGLSPEPRTLFASGALLLLAAAFTLDKLPLRITPLRLGMFVLVVIAAWLAASYGLHSPTGLAARDELIVVPVVLVLAGLATFLARRGTRYAAVAILLVALVPTALTWGLYNPLQRTDAIFRKPDTEVTRGLDALARTREDGAIAVTGFADAVLNGAGYRSVTHVITTPSPELFRPYFPDQDDAEFDRVFNRYAHVSLTTRRLPYVVGNTGVRVPLETMRRYAATR